MARNDYFSGMESKGHWTALFLPLIFFNFSVYFHAKLLYYHGNSILSRKLHAVSVFVSYPPYFNSIFRQANTVNNFMSCHRFNLTCCRKITHFPVTQSIVYTTIYFQSTAALRTAFSMFLSYIVWLFRTMPLLSAPEIVPTSMYNSCRKAARDIPDGLFFFQFM